MNHDQARFYLAGMIDGEGHVECSLSNRGFWMRRIVIANTDLALIQAVAECCELLEYDYRISTRKRQDTRWKPCMVVKISGIENLRRVLDEVPLRSPDKIRALHMAVSNAQRPQLSGRQKRRVDELLAEGRSTTEIAAEIGCAVRTIQYRKAGKKGAKS